ncbi:MAG TPA: translocation/assembly module TamB domain-containing protein [Vicinamibacterales bacterium]|nr:translocation/assembly module TamB domain-containing protein [Vicinamibacterales bacterium]
MRGVRRTLQIVTLVGTLVVGILAVSLIVSQTPWFRDWLRRYIVRESQQYLNGELSIGALGGNLFYGVQLRDVTLTDSGERIVAVKAIDLDYSILTLVSKGIVLDGIALHEPQFLFVRTAQGWNVRRLVKEQRQEADRKGPGRPVSLPSIEITDGTIAIRDPIGASGVTLPRLLRDVDIKASFEYAPVHYTIGLEHVSFTGASPELVVRQLTGKIAVRDDNVYLDTMALHTAESAVRFEGVLEQYMRAAVVKVTGSGKASLPEFGRIFPIVAPYKLHPDFEVKTNGPVDRMGLDLNLRSEAGNSRGQVVADLRGPVYGLEGDLNVERLNLVLLLNDREQRSDITGLAKIDLDFADTPKGVPMNERTRGTFTFAGPRVFALGYRASNVKVKGTIDGRRLVIDGRAAAYGGTATAKGTVLTPSRGRPIEYDLRGSANGVNLRDLPRSTGAPVVTTSLSFSSYHARGKGRSSVGTAVLNRSTIDGATIGTGTVVDFDVTPATIAYVLRGTVESVDLERIGRAFDLPSVATPEYASNLNGTINATGSWPRAVAARRGRDTSATKMTLDATGMLKNSEIMGGRLPELEFEAHLANGALAAKVNGRFEDFDPARLLSRPEAKGNVTGTVTADFTIANVDAPLTPASVTAAGQLALVPSTIGGLKIDSASVDGTYANQIGDVRTFTLTGPDVKANASGRIALDRSSASNLKYHVEAVNIPELAKLAGQKEVGGSAVLDGTITGNAASLVATGTIDGSNISYGQNSALDLDSRYTVTLPELQVAKMQVDATTKGTFIKAGSFQINELTATTTYDGQRVRFTANIKEQSRELDAKGQVILHTDHQEIHLPELSVRTQGVEWRTVAGNDAAIKYSPDSVVLKNVRLVSGNQSLDVSGTIALKGAAPSAALDVKAQNVDLKQLETLLLQNRGFTGTLSANARVTGTMAAPAIDGQIEIRNGAFGTYKYEALVADVDYTGRKMILDATLRQSATEQITAKGSVPLSFFSRGTGAHSAAVAGEEIDVHITSTALNLAVVQGFTDVVTNVTGTLQADVRVTGSGADPHVVGFIDIRNGGFGVPLAGGSYTGLNTRINLTPDLMSLQEFQILDEHGRALNIAGQLAVHEKQLGEVNITVTSDNFELIDNELGDVGVGASLKITGELRRPKIVGDLRLATGRLEVDRLMQLFYDPYATEAIPEVVSAERVAEGAGSAEEATRIALKKAEVSAAPPGAAEKAVTDAPPAPTGIFEPLTLDIRLSVPDNLVLRGRDLRSAGPTGTALGAMNATVGGDVQLRKNPGGQITLLGNVQTVRGTYEFQGRRFELVRGGQIRFVGDALINPFVDISATRLIPGTGVEARVRVTGTVKAPELTLTSNPPLEESDILALIVFNRPVNELGTGERSSLAATAGGIATGFIAAPLGESIGKALDLDLFEITTSTEEGDLGAGITLGQQVGDKAFLKLRQQFGERNVTEFLLEYQLNRFLRVVATAAPETSGSGNRLNQRRIERGGIDLIFFFSY